MRVVAVLLFLLTPAYSHDIYSHWMIPDTGRVSSCCNNIDCSPRQFKQMGGKWFVLFENKWILVPEKKLEHNYSDAWESPDGLSHACINPQGVVYCASVGDGM